MLTGATGGAVHLLVCAARLTAAHLTAAADELPPLDRLTADVAAAPDGAYRLRVRWADGAVHEAQLSPGAAFARRLPPGART